MGEEGREMGWRLACAGWEVGRGSGDGEDVKEGKETSDFWQETRRGRAMWLSVEC